MAGRGKMGLLQAFRLPEQCNYNSWHAGVAFQVIRSAVR